MTAPSVIAIVDDDASVRNAMGQLIRSFDLAVELYGSAHELLQSSSLDRIDCVITDIRMPGMDGFALCNTLRARGLRMPVIFMTAVAQDGDAQRASDTGAAGFLGKPFEDTELFRCLARALNGDGHGAGR